ncbi:hypothetical protein TSAR_005144 [Trichomalopsis sarcophagae]|uniref:Odorant receptor n=1 Tax=Trichomalopsis sarcophagae TaxID=543379 RepID=A0A232FE11_9HYME|nr:hypothetical protein TSAR_005144 [Trichomalopsis sarcophagae]
MDDFSQINDVMRFGVFTTAQIFHLFCFNYMGQSILTAIEMLEEKIYNVNWYELPLESRVLVQVMILKNYRPTVIQGGIFPLSLPTFTAVMKTSMSYFTVIKSTR